MRFWKGLFLFALFIFSLAAQADPISVKIYSVSRDGKSGRYLGVIIAKNTRRGLLLVPRLHGLPRGQHGFHLHDKPSCNNFAKAAGPHWDPKDTGHHRGPYRPDGHRGDLPFLTVNHAGFAKYPVLAPHLSVSDLKGHAFVVHEHGDNYTDTPANGGGGARIACGVID